MDKIVIPLEAGSSGPASALSLRPWQPSDAPALLVAAQDSALRRWTSLDVNDPSDAGRWIDEQRRGWESGERLAFAVVGDEILGHVVLKRSAGAVAEVGYWTAAAARGRGVAPNALLALTEWALSRYDSLARLELIHQVDNVASCRVAVKCGYGLEATLPALPPTYPLDGHLHVRARS
ncbi:GNAT family N-acetyltransferase [Streptomyces acidiscabies]|uniref:GNAT family N-acetyltransferase n=1 Tax=Streptomyces acidiscabies TaxID=42234 RepID=UPI00096283C5|nr:GNAT family N-acetyltransferase [Streptomyces acidiscabies]GAV45285.1 ribosomal-protein-L7/L12-serine acetyltransferase [Streptomyces acidiscabies]